MEVFWFALSIVCFVGILELGFRLAEYSR
jgi:hypothetical protein